MKTQQSKTSLSDAPARVSRQHVYLYTAAALLSLVGLADAIYLTVKRLNGGGYRCTITSGCEEVLTSAYATIGGVPLAVLGALAYFTVFSLATLAIFGNQAANTLLFYLVALMFAFTIWLFIVQAFVLHAFCQFCLLSGAVTLLLALIIAADRFYLKRTATV
jgi:uncharacterized membrane protein